jgi:hypothetical protein
MFALLVTRRVSATLAVVGVLILLGGCGSKSPTRESPIRNVTGVSLLPGTDFLKVGQTATFTIEAAYADGTRAPMTATSWGCDNPNVATVSGGTVTAVGPGEATVFGDCQHGRATRRLRVTPDYNGTWTGGYFWRTCTDSGQFAAERVCADMPLQQEVQMMLRLVQDRERTTGTLALGALAGEVTGTIALPGHIDIDGAIRYEAEGEVVTVTLTDWATLATGDRMTGTFKMVWTVSGVTGDMTIGCELTSVGRTNQLIQPAFAPERSGERTTLSALIRRLAGVSR